MPAYNPSEIANQVSATLANQKKPISGLGLAGTIAGSLALLGQASQGGGVLGNLFGGAQPVRVVESSGSTLETAITLPILMNAYAGAYGGYGGHGHGHGCGCGCGHGKHGHHGDDDYVTKEVFNLARESAREASAKDAEIAELKARIYADGAVKAEVDPLKERVCTLETAAAVNARSDKDWRRFVNAEFVHQPKARFNESIVVCRQCGCADCVCGRRGRRGGWGGQGDGDQGDE